MMSGFTMVQEEVSSPAFRQTVMTTNYRGTKPWLQAKTALVSLYTKANVTMSLIWNYTFATS